MEFIINFFAKVWIKRIIILSVFVLIIYLTRELFNLFLFTFILTYLMYRIQNFFISILKRFVKIKQKIMAIFLYLILGGTIVFILYNYLPTWVDQVGKNIQALVKLYNSNTDNKIINLIKANVTGIDIAGYANEGFSMIIKYTTNILNFLIALILSLFFLLEKNKIKRFTRRFSDSKIGPIYNELEYFGQKFLNSFGKVIEAQVLISLTNTMLSAVFLTFLKFDQYIFGLSVMVFLLGMIPVAGVIVSLVPLSVIGYTIGDKIGGAQMGFQWVIYVMIMVAVLHALEAYVLNPKFMSYKTDLPIFYTLLVLIVSERIIGMWGLIIGIPIFMFILDVLEVNSSHDEKEMAAFDDD